MSAWTACSATALNTAAVSVIRILARSAGGARRGRHPDGCAAVLAPGLTAWGPVSDEAARAVGRPERRGSLSMFEFPVLVGDIGGTNARFGLIETKGDQPRLLSHEATADHADPSSAIKA